MQWVCRSIVIELPLNTKNNGPRVPFSVCASALPYILPLGLAGPPFSRPFPALPFVRIAQTHGRINKQFCQEVVCSFVKYI